MGSLDIVTLVGYFLIVAAVGYWASTKNQGDSESYFLSGRSVGWIAIGASLFASNISAEHFVSLAESGAGSGLAVGQFEWIACFILLLLGWLFVPFYLRTGVFTMPEFLERRYNRHCRTYLSAISLIAYVLTKISVSLYAGSMVLREVVGWDIYTGAVVLVIATGIYTVFGGLRAVIYTELFQAFVLIAGAIVLTAAAISKAGGLDAVMNGVPTEHFNLWKESGHKDFPWTGILFGAPILGIWYWCTDQMIVQRTLAAKNVAEAQRGTIFAGFLKLLPVFILVLPGIAGRVAFPEAAPKHIYATMVNELLPAGVKGLVVAALLAAVMSSLAAVFNSSSTLVVSDFFKKARPQASEKELVRAGQLSTVVLVGIGLLWLPFLGQMSEQLFVYLQKVQAYISPPIAAIFLVGILWKRVNGAGALATLLTGFVLGAARYVLEFFSHKLPGWMSSGIFETFASVNFLHFAIYLFAVSIVVLVGVSLMTSPPSDAHLEIFKSRDASPEEDASPGKRRTNIVLSVILVAAVLAMWVYFSPWFFK